MLAYMNKLADAIPASGPPASRPLSRLADLLRAHAPVDGSVEQCVPGVHAIRASRPNADLVHGVQGSSVCIVA